MKFYLNFGEDIYYNISIEHLDNYVYMRFEATKDELKFVRIKIHVSIVCRYFCVRSTVARVVLYNTSRQSCQFCNP